MPGHVDDVQRVVDEVLAQRSHEKEKLEKARTRKEEQLETLNMKLVAVKSHLEQLDGWIDRLSRPLVAEDYTHCVVYPLEEAPKVSDIRELLICKDRVKKKGICFNVVWSS